MKDNYSLISVKLVTDVIKDKGFYYIEAAKCYGEDYIGPEYIVATDDKDFESSHPEFEGMIVLPVSKFIELIEVINDYTRNDMREQKRRERHHNEDGYYEEIPESDDGNMAPLVIKDRPMNPVEDAVETFMDNERLMSAIKQLKETPKRRLLAYYFEGKTHREIAKREGVNRNAVEKSLYNALEKIKKLL